MKFIRNHNSGIFRFPPGTQALQVIPALSQKTKAKDNNRTGMNPIHPRLLRGIAGEQTQPEERADDSEDHEPGTDLHQAFTLSFIGLHGWVPGR
ncbi:MAG: hypothetical protein WC110_08725 [Bacteroidales bacterium]